MAAPPSIIPGPILPPGPTIGQPVWPIVSRQPLNISARHSSIGRLDFRQAAICSWIAATSAHSSTRRSRSAFPITDTELALMAAAAIIGDSRSPKAG